MIQMNLYLKAARDGERCSRRMKCAVGLQCVGKILEVDGQGTCRKSSNLLRLIVLLYLRISLFRIISINPDLKKCE